MRINGSKPNEINYPVPVSNGLLCPEHRRRIGGAVWEFIWFVDRTTSETNGIGKVLGGKPVTYNQIATDLGTSQRTVGEHCKRLMREGYIRMNRTPYGYQVQVMKSKKFFQKRVEETCRSEGERVEDFGRSEWKKSVERVEETCKSNKTLQDNTVDAAAAAAFSSPGKEWEILGLKTGLGTSRFQQVWTFFYSHRNGYQLSEAMERTIQQAQGKGIKVPKPFYEAKRRVERQEREADTGSHRGLDLPKIEAWE